MINADDWVMAERIAERRNQSVAEVLKDFESFMQQVKCEPNCEKECCQNESMD